MPDVLIYGDTVRMPELRHEVALGIPDPFLYVERNGAKHVAIGSMEIPRIEEVGGGLECHPLEEVAVRAVKALGISAAVVPSGFPLFLADRLRREGVELTVDGEFFDERRRV